MGSNEAEQLRPASRPHAVCIACPAQSHIKATLKLAKLLHARGFYITFVNSEFNHRRFLNTKGPRALDGLPDFRFAAILDGIPPSDLGSTQDVPMLLNSILTFMKAPFRELVARLNDPELSGGGPRVSCVIADTMPFAIDVAREFGVPSVSYWSFSACGFMGFRMFRPLLEQGITPFKDDSYLTNGYLDKPVQVPGMKNMQFRDLPSFFQTTDPTDPPFHCLMECADAAARASAIVVHSFDALEPNLIATLNSTYSGRVYPIAPMQLLVDQIESKSTLDTISYSLWKEEPQCLRWLDSKPANSVVYVNFGSITTMSKEHLTEFAMGLVSSEVSFLWVIRPDLVVGESAVLPPEFEERAARTGFISGWCPQEEVLNHPAVGGFLTHCGWGSMMESLTAGVPVLCWPFFGDQPTNCKYACSEWGVGVEIEKDVKRAAVEEVVKELMMNGGEGEKMRKKAGEWRKLAREAAGPGGSSVVNLDRLVNDVLLGKGV
ncbi:unnamed protein product [Linum tenue]|uniref:Glycosyltransferase n=1 Tax=Linum tenue TaxID=586396 RepID=A0AAV0HHG8_9ROSI|nr:unnamed protein product [Linum tenue]